MMIAVFAGGPRLSAAYIPHSGHSSLLQPVRLESAGDTDAEEVKRALRIIRQSKIDRERHIPNVFQNTTTTGTSTVGSGSTGGDSPASATSVVIVNDRASVCYLALARERLVLSRFIDSILDPPRR